MKTKQRAYASRLIILSEPIEIIFKAKNASTQRQAYQKTKESKKK